MLDPQQLREHLIEHGSNDAEVIARALDASEGEVVAAAQRLEEEGDVTISYSRFVPDGPESAFISHKGDD